MENRNILIGLGTGLVAGFLLGFGVGSYVNTGSGAPAPAKAAATMPPVAPAGMPGNELPVGQLEAVARIPTVKEALTREPDNAALWVQLGNDYFDTHQPKLSVEAYAKAIALSPDNPKLPDILTDQGVMYREMKEFDKAVANFQKAGKIDPRHLPSMLNMGIVYFNDKHDAAAARKVWNKVIELGPGSPQAEQAKKFIATM